MGQGTESCGGYDVDCDPYDFNESENFSVWAGRDCDYLVSKMSVSHMRNAIRICRQMASQAIFSCDEDKWNEWIDVFEDEIANRRSSSNKAAPTKAEKKPTRGAKKEMRCICGHKFMARVADLKRGWGKSCSKSCAAKSRK